MSLSVVFRCCFTILKVGYDKRAAGLHGCWTEDGWDRLVHQEVEKRQKSVCNESTFWTQTYLLKEMMGFIDSKKKSRIKPDLFFNLASVSRVSRLKFCVSSTPTAPNQRLRLDSADWRLSYRSYWTAASSTTSLSGWCSNFTAVSGHTHTHTF